MVPLSGCCRLRKQDCGTGRAELHPRVKRPALDYIERADKSADHVAALRAAGVTPHVTQNNGPTKTGKLCRSAIDARTTRHWGYGASQSRRPMIECIFGWCKLHGTMRKTRHRGIRRVAGDFLLNLIAYNLVRIPKLLSV
jgi:Transposase DDE domain